MAIVTPRRIYEGSRIPQPVPTILEIDTERHSLDDILTVNFGPNHPSTHGVLRLVVDLDGETVAGIRAVIGYLHTGFEKNMEAKTWWKSVTYAPRIDYVSFQANELVYVLAVEKLLELETPERCQWLRETLREFLARNRSYVATAEAMILHRNTIQYRVTQAMELCRQSFDDPDAVFKVQTALEVCRWMAPGVLRAAN